MSLYNFLKIILEFFNCILFFYYILVSVNKGDSFIFESLVSKIWFDNLRKLSIISYSLHSEIITENLTFSDGGNNCKTPTTFFHILNRKFLQQ